jgi:ubiquitin-protein ligase
MREACELQAATDHYWARPLEDNLFEWHFTVRGPSSTDFDGGLYHGRILLPPEYPMKPPNIILLTVRNAANSHSICKILFQTMADAVMQQYNASKHHI